MGASPYLYAPPGTPHQSQFWCLHYFFDASSEVHLRSSLQSLHDVIKVTPFNHNVHHRGLWTEAAYGSLKPPPTRRLRRTYLHLSYSMTFTRLHDTSVAKNIERVDNMRSSIMDAGQNGQSMGASFGVCDWLGESGTASAKRISHGGKPDSESTRSAAISSDR